MKLAKIFTCMLFLVLSLGVSKAWAEHHEGRPATQVVAVDTHGKTAEYLEGLKALPGALARLAPGAEFRVYEAAFAGPDTGDVYIVISFPSMAALSAATAKISADKEWGDVVKKLEAMGRTLESNSILMDRTPK